MKLKIYKNHQSQINQGDTMHSLHLHAQDYQTALNFLLGREIANIRERRAISRAYLADAYQIDYDWLEKIEAGIATINASDLFLLCKKLGSNFNEVFNCVFDANFPSQNLDEYNSL
jgi:DNA-binding transcriptional regulator YiaG